MSSFELRCGCLGRVLLAHYDGAACHRTREKKESSAHTPRADQTQRTTLEPKPTLGVFRAYGEQESIGLPFIRMQG